MSALDSRRRRRELLDWQRQRATPNCQRRTGWITSIAGSNWPRNNFERSLAQVEMISRLFRGRTKHSIPISFRGTSPNGTANTICLRAVKNGQMTPLFCGHFRQDSGGGSRRRRRALSGLPDASSVCASVHCRASVSAAAGEEGAQERGTEGNGKT